MSNNKITLAYGNGGKFTSELINDVFKKIFDNNILNQLNDSAVLNIQDKKIAFTTDSYTIKPVFFKGGDIGKLAVCGTVNDLIVSGAKPLYISSSFIIEEGYDFEDLSKIVRSMKTAADQSNVSIVTGDTKVVEKGSVDSIFINTSGIGIINDDIKLNLSYINENDVVIINGDIGDHGVSILLSREDFPITSSVTSDCDSLLQIYDAMHEFIKNHEIKIMRDPTRGGIATTLNEFVEGSDFSFIIDEKSLPIKNEVKAICEMTGFDPLYMANEGKILIVISRRSSEKLLKKLKNTNIGKNSRIIGKATKKEKGKVILNTQIGGYRILDKLTGNMLPRIC
ncbi:MAG: hydrogenase expression/formation protein HypE [Spirochaetes bacterium]|nr:hydrogenase expression/formation protein HypE [Spirochaetota bacterium]